MAFDVLQRPLDANGNRIAGVGAPTTAGDATTTDNATAPSNPAATATPGNSLLASPANHVHQAVHSVHADANAALFGDVQFVSGSGVTLSQTGQVITVAVAGGLVNKITIADEGQKYVSGTVEQIIAEYAVNLDDAGTGAASNIQVRLAGIAKVGAGVGTYKVYIGATAPGATTGGTARATATTSSTTDVTVNNLGSAFSNPGGLVLVQITAINDTAATKSFLRGLYLSIG